MFCGQQVSNSLQPHPDCVHLFVTNADVDAFNTLYLSTLTSESAIAYAVDKVEGNAKQSSKDDILRDAQTKPPRKTDGLRRSVLFRLGAIYIVTTNIDVEDGLGNHS